MNPLFCTTNLLLKANNLRLTKMRVSMLVDERLVVAHRRPSERRRLYGQALMDLMEWGDDNESEQVANFSEHNLRRVARRRALARFLTNGSQIVWNIIAHTVAAETYKSPGKNSRGSSRKCSLHICLGFPH